MLRNTKKLLAVACALAMTLPTTALAAAPEYNFANEVQRGDTMSIEGALPDFSTLKDPELAKEAQAMVDGFVSDTLEAVTGKKTERITTTYSYAVTGDSKYLSVILYAETAYANTSSAAVKTITFDKASPRIVTLADVLGKDAYKTATTAVKKAIDDAPKSYFDGEDAFAAVSAESDFYVTGGSEVIVIFDKYEIAPGTMGMPAFPVGKANK